jgi:hypothetical protein
MVHYATEDTMGKIILRLWANYEENFYFTDWLLFDYILMHSLCKMLILTQVIIMWQGNSLDRENKKNWIYTLTNTFIVEYKAWSVWCKNSSNGSLIISGRFR